MSNSTPPGWFPDPERGPDAGAPQERYWDGGGWTARTRPAAAPAPGAQTVDAPTPTWDGAGVPVRPGVPPLAAGPSAVCDASPAYGHPAVPEPAASPGYGFPPPAEPPGYGFPPPVAPVAYGFPPATGPYPPAAPGYPPPPYGAPYGRPAPGARTGLIVGLLAGALALTGVVVAGAVVLVKDSDAARPAWGSAQRVPPTSGAPDPVGPPGDQPGDQPSGEASAQAPAPVSPDGTIKDAVHGWTVPLPASWTSSAHDPATTLSMGTGPYDCALSGGCVRGSFSIDTEPVDGPDAASAARTTIAAYAPQLYGDLVSHQELTAGQVTVGGVSGYAVHWHVAARQGAQGYVLLVAVPTGSGGFSILVGSVDDDPQAPQPAVLDQIVAGIRSVGAPGSV